MTGFLLQLLGYFVAYHDKWYPIVVPLLAGVGVVGGGVAATRSVAKWLLGQARRQPA